jgi:hypothetical protein
MDAFLLGEVADSLSLTADTLEKEAPRRQVREQDHRSAAMEPCGQDQPVDSVTLRATGLSGG